MQKTMGSRRRDVAVRLSQRSIGEGRKDKIPDDGVANIDEDTFAVSLPLQLFLVLLLDADPLGREAAGGSECNGEFAWGRCSSSDACPARSKFERGVMRSQEEYDVTTGSVFSRIVQRIVALD